MTTPRPMQESWEQWIGLWHLSFYLMIIGFTGFAVVQDDATTTTRLMIVLCSALLGIWYGVSLRHDRDFWEKRWWFTACYFAAGWGVWIVLVNLNPISSYLLFALFPHLCIKLPPRQCILGIWVLTGCLLWIQFYLDGPSLPSLIMSLATGVLTSILKLFIEAIIMQNIERRLLIEKLDATRAELAAAERQAGIFGERQRLAREIHDTLAQGFTSIVIQLEAADESLPPHLTTVRKYLEQARTTARESLGEARRLVWALQPEGLERASLAQAIARSAARWTEGCGIPAVAIVTGEPCALRPEVEVTLLRAAQEGLTNIRKYACAQRVSLTLSYMDDLVTLDVQDDGIGFDPSRLADQNDERGGGYGLPGMRARVEQLGGTLLIESAPGEGTTLAIAMPIEVKSLEIARQ